MTDEVLERRGTTLIRRLCLAPGEATPWHRDRFHRVSVIVSGEALRIEFRDGGEPHRVTLAVGQTDWDEPEPRVHRAVNIGSTDYEEVTTFFLDRENAEPQDIIR